MELLIQKENENAIHDVTSFSLLSIPRHYLHAVYNRTHLFPKDA